MPFDIQVISVIGIPPPWEIFLCDPGPPVNCVSVATNLQPADLPYLISPVPFPFDTPGFPFIVSAVTLDPLYSGDCEPVSFVNITPTNTPTPTITPTPTQTTNYSPPINECYPLYLDVNDLSSIYTIDLNTFTTSPYFTPTNFSGVFTRSATKIWLSYGPSIDEYDATVFPPTLIRTISTGGILVSGIASYSNIPDTLLIANGASPNNAYNLIDISTLTASIISPNPLFTLRPGRVTLTGSFIYRDSTQGLTYVNTTNITSTDSLLEIYDDSGNFIASGDTFSLGSGGISAGVFSNNGLIYIINPTDGSIYTVSQSGQQLIFVLALPNQIPTFFFGVGQSDNCGGPAVEGYTLWQRFNSVPGPSPTPTKTTFFAPPSPTPTRTSTVTPTPSLTTNFQSLVVFVHIPNI